MSTFNYEKDAHGIVTVTMDMTGPVNAMNGEYRESMGTTVEKLENESYFLIANFSELILIHPRDVDTIYQYFAICRRI